MEEERGGLCVGHIVVEGKAGRGCHQRRSTEGRKNKADGVAEMETRRGHRQRQSSRRGGRTRPIESPKEKHEEVLAGCGRRWLATILAGEEAACVTA